MKLQKAIEAAGIEFLDENGGGQAFVFESRASPKRKRNNCERNLLEPKPPGFNSFCNSHFCTIAIAKMQMYQPVAALLRAKMCP